MRKLAFTAAAIAVMSGVVVAENARTAALSNSPAFKDKNDVTVNPAWSAEYRQFVEFNYNNSNDTTADVGHILGVAPITDMISLGGYVSGDETNYHPHLVMGFDFDNVKFGFEAYFEREADKDKGSHKNVATDTTDVANGTTTITTLDSVGESSNSVAELGANIGAILELGDAELEVLTGFGLSPERQKSSFTLKNNTTNATTNATTTTEQEVVAKSKGTFNYMVGGQLRYPMSDNELLVGLGFGGNRSENALETTTNSSYTETGTGTDVSTSTETTSEATVVTSNIEIDLNAGYKFNFDKGLSFAIMDEFSWGRNRDEEVARKDTLSGVDEASYVINDIKLDQNNVITLNHMITIAGEKEFGKSRLFDKHFFRLGLGYEVNTVITKDTSDIADMDHVNHQLVTDQAGLRVKDATDFSELNGSAGFGFERGRFQFDLYVKNVSFNWADKQSGVLSLFDIAGATATIDFGKDGSDLRRNDPEWEKM